MLLVFAQSIGSGLVLPTNPPDGQGGRQYDSAEQQNLLHATPPQSGERLSPIIKYFGDLAVHNVIGNGQDY